MNYLFLAQTKFYREKLNEQMFNSVEDFAQGELFKGILHQQIYFVRNGWGIGQNTRKKYPKYP